MLRTLLVFFVIALAGLWACAAIWIDGPDEPVFAGAVALSFALGSIATFVWARGFGKACTVYTLMVASALAWWLSIEPSNDRNWLPEVARLPRVEIDGDQATVFNVRNFKYRSENSFTERWETRTYDLSDVKGIDFFLSYWGSPKIAHTIMSWDFGDGKPLAISIETRKEVGEDYSAVLGFFRQFEIYYTVADERDVIGVRTNIRGERVRRYRLRTPPDVARAILIDYFEEINRLADEPRWYNAATHNCTTTIRHHVQHVAPGSPFNWRFLVNGHLDELGYMRGTIESDLPFEELRACADITERAKAAGDAENFSARIRASCTPAT
ncbi:MAG: DUF4105 domain-containing protein [Myxococcota bacterium]|nr:DUF4105 domain-containing protein [Myxococcota bacterium]